MAAPQASLFRNTKTARAEAHQDVRALGELCFLRVLGVTMTAPAARTCSPIRSPLTQSCLGPVFDGMSGMEVVAIGAVIAYLRAMALSKICGLSTAETVAAAIAGRAAYVGFNFFEKSPRYVTPQAAGRLAQPVQGKAKIVAVTRRSVRRAAARDRRGPAPRLHPAARTRDAGPGARGRHAHRRGDHQGDLGRRGRPTSRKLAEFEAVADHLMLDAKAAAGRRPARRSRHGVRLDR